MERRVQIERCMLESKLSNLQEIVLVGSARILIVEDEPKVAQALREGLLSEGYEITLAITGEEAFFQASSEHFDLILLDLMLPGRSGIEVLETLRKKGTKIPVLILTARDTIEDRIKGLDTGADDYLVKPFAFPELLARIRALLRRGRPAEGAETKRKLGDLDMDLVTRTAMRTGKRIELTVREFDLLECARRFE